MPLTVDQLRTFDSNWGNLVVQQDSNGAQVKGGGLKHALASLFRTDSAQARNKATYTAIRNAIMQDDRFFAPEVKAKADQLLKGLDNGSGISASTIKGIIRQLDEMSTPEKQREAVRKAAIGHLATSVIVNHIPDSVKQKYIELAADFAAYRSDPNASMSSINVGARVNEFNQLMLEIFNDFGDDEEAMEIFCKTLNNYATGGDAVSINPADKIRSLADTVLDNVQEANHIGTSLHYGGAAKSFLATLKRTGALRPNVMIDVANKGATLPKCGLDHLISFSDAGEIHRAISKMADAMDKARSEMNPSDTRGLDDNELGACLVKTAMARLSDNERWNLLKALESKGGMNLLGFYAQRPADPKAQRMTLVYSSLVAHLRAEFMMRNAGESVVAPAVDAAALPPEAICEFANGVDDVVTGGAAQQIKDFALGASGIDDAEEPGMMLRGRMNAIAKGLVAKSTVIRMDSLRAGELGEKIGPPDLDLQGDFEEYFTQGFEAFDEDFATIYMSNGTIVAPTTPQEARDALVQFITDDPAARYDEHTDPEVKIKVNILLGRMTASTIGDMTTAVGAAFEPEGKRRVINPYGNLVKEQHVFSKDENGTVNVRHSIRIDKPILPMINKEHGNPWAFSGDDNSYFEASMHVSFPADNFNRLARADWSQLDTSDVIEAVDGGPGNKAPRRYEKIPGLVYDDFRFTGEVSMSFRLHADALQSAPMESNQFVVRWHRHEDPV